MPRSLGDRMTGIIRRSVILAAALGLMMVLAVPGGLADAVSGNGRDGTSVPGPAVSSSGASSAEAPTVDGRASSARPAPASAASAGATPVGAVDNGRGGTDPALGPNPIPAPAPLPADELSQSGFDSDSGLAPVLSVPGPSSVAPLRATTAPVDQDVAGAPTGGPPGTDPAPDDGDGTG